MDEHSSIQIQISPLHIGWITLKEHKFLKLNYSKDWIDHILQTCEMIWNGLLLKGWNLMR